MSSVQWLVEDQLASFNNDLFRAELSPRRCCFQSNGQVKIITPEEAAQREEQYVSQRDNALKQGSVVPNKNNFFFIDHRETYVPKVWKIYRKAERQYIDKHGAPVKEEFFERVSEADNFEKATAIVNELERK
jgi:hypothetical protein